MNKLVPALVILAAPIAFAQRGAGGGHASVGGGGGRGSVAVGRPATGMRSGTFGTSPGYGSFNSAPAPGHLPGSYTYANGGTGYPGRSGGGRAYGYGFSTGHGGGNWGYGHGGRRYGNGGVLLAPYPVFVGGYYDGYYGPGYPSDYGYGYGFTPEAPPPDYGSDVAPPPVIINQNFVPDTASPVVRDYSNGELPQPGQEGRPGMYSYQAPIPRNPDPRQAAGRDDQPTIYLLAFKDQTIMPALAYWVEGDTLTYITREGTQNRVSLSLVDREFSRQLNAERHVEFNLP